VWEGKNEYCPQRPGNWLRHGKAVEIVEDYFSCELWKIFATGLVPREVLQGQSSYY
jgi:hypothetical protein